jgi:hypothetical protein
MNGIILARRLRGVFPRGRLYNDRADPYAGPNIRAAWLAAGFDAHPVKTGELDMLEKLLEDPRPNSGQAPR